MKTEIEHERCEYTTSLDTSRYLFSSHHVYRMGDCLTGDEWKNVWRRGRRRSSASVAEGEQAQETPPCLRRRSVRGGQARPRRTAVALPLRFSPGVQ